MKRKNRHSCFSFLLTSGYFSFSISIFYIDLSIIIPLLGKLEVLGPPCGGRSHVRGRHCPTFQNEKRVFTKVNFTRQFRTPDRIAHMVLGVWVIPMPMYFNCCPFLLNNPNCRPPSGDQIIFIPKKGNL